MGSSPAPGLFDDVRPNGRNRRIFLLAAHPGDGRFTQPTAAAQAWRPELVFMPPKPPLPGFRSPSRHAVTGPHSGHPTAAGLPPAGARSETFIGTVTLLA
jgi:hypothetical protein